MITSKLIGLGEKCVINFYRNLKNASNILLKIIFILKKGIFFFSYAIYSQIMLRSISFNFVLQNFCLCLSVWKMQFVPNAWDNACTLTLQTPHINNKYFWNFQMRIFFLSGNSSTQTSSNLTFFLDMEIWNIYLQKNICINAFPF